MTILIVALLGDRTKQEWYDWVKQRVENNVGYETPESVPPVFRSMLQNQQTEAGDVDTTEAQRNTALSLNGLGTGGLLSAIPHVLSGQPLAGEDATVSDASADAKSPV